MTVDAESTVNVPQLLILGAVGYLAYRWVFQSNGEQTGTPGPVQPSSQLRNIRTFNGSVPQVYLDRIGLILNIFPSSDRREILWNLLTISGDVQTLISRLADGERLAQPPPTFNPRFPGMAPAFPAPPPPAAAPQKVSSKSLIAQYKLRAAATAQDCNGDVAAAAGPDLDEAQTRILECRTRLMANRKREKGERSSRPGTEEKKMSPMANRAQIVRPVGRT